MAEAEHDKPGRLETVRVIEEIRTLDIDAAWKDILAVPEPGPDPALPSAKARSLFQRYAPWFVQANLPHFVVLLAFGSVVLANAIVNNQSIFVGSLVTASVITLIALFPKGYREITPDTDLEKARATWALRLKNFESSVTDAAFRKRIRELQTIREKLRALQSEPVSEHRDWVRLHKSAQRRQYLDQILLAEADIPGLNELDLEILRSRGVLTAADCNTNRLHTIPFSGSATAEVVLDWRRRVAKGFHYDPEAGLGPEASRYFEKKFSQWQRDTFGRFKMAPYSLARLNKQIEKNREQSYRRLCELWDALQIVERRHARPAQRPRARS